MAGNLETIAFGLQEAVGFNVVLISVVGTQITDNLVDNFGVTLVTTTIVFSVTLAVAFAAWYASEQTLSIHGQLPAFCPDSCEVTLHVTIQQADRVLQPHRFDPIPRA